MNSPAVDELMADQPRVARFLSTAIDSGKIGHSYLFTGTDTESMDAASRLIALQVLGELDGEDAERIERGTHPDFHVLTPGSSVGYLADQVREVIEDASLAPIRGNGKVFVFKDAERLYGTSANALLKTLEEPSDDCVFILTCRNADAVLATLVSRCQPVPFASVSGSTIAARVAERSGHTPAEARFTLNYKTTVADAVDALTDEKHRGLVGDALSFLEGIGHATMWECVKGADRMCDAATGDIAELVKRHEEYLEANADFLTAGGKKDVEKRQKREIAAAEKDGVRTLVAVFQSLLRDCLAYSDNMPDNEVTPREREFIASMRQHGEDRIMDALGVCDQALDNMNHNVGSKLVVETMALGLREKLCPPSYR